MHLLRILDSVDDTIMFPPISFHVTHQLFVYLIMLSCKMVESLKVVEHSSTQLFQRLISFLRHQATMYVGSDRVTEHVNLHVGIFLKVMSCTINATM